MERDQMSRKKQAARPGNPPGAARRNGWARRLWAKPALAVAGAALFVLLAELVLALLGVKPVAEEGDPFVGFAGARPLYVRRTAPDGRPLRKTAPGKLQWFNKQTFPERKAPGACRIFCLGGSTTYGRPYRDVASFCCWLRKFLKAAEPGREWEVINAGGISYASYRIAVLMRELLEYEPDLFIVYAGHNEFLEKRTYARIARLPRCVRRLGAALSRLRLYALLRRIRTRRGPRVRAAEKPVLPPEVAPVLAHTVGPTSYTRDDRFRDRAVAHYEYNLRRMIRIARSAGARIVFVMPAANLKDMRPFKSQHDAGLNNKQRAQWSELYTRAAGSFEAGDAAAAESACREALRLDRRHAGTHYLLGRILFALGRHEQARQSFVRAIDEDICPLRMLSVMQARLRAVCRDQDVPLLAFDRLLSERVQREHGHTVLGSESFLDHLHPTPDVHRFLALKLFDLLVALRIVRPGPGWGQASIDRISKQMRARLSDPGVQAEAAIALGNVFNWAGRPEEAAATLRNALAELEPDARMWCELGISCLKRGRTAEAEHSFREAVKLDPDYVFARVSLGRTLAGRGRHHEAVRHLSQALERAPSDPAAHAALGGLYAAEKSFAAALVHYSRALRADPHSPILHANLGNVLSEMGHYDEALARFSSALRTDPSYVDARLNLAHTFLRQRKMAEAARHYRAVLELDPQNAQARHWLAVAEQAFLGKD